MATAPMLFALSPDTTSACCCVGSRAFARPAIVPLAQPHENKSISLNTGIGVSPIFSKTSADNGKNTLRNFSWSQLDFSVSSSVLDPVPQGEVKIMSALQWIDWELDEYEKHPAADLGYANETHYANEMHISAPVPSENFIR